MENEKN